VQYFGSAAINRMRNWTVANRYGIAKVAKNISWLSADNFAATVSAAIVSVVVARTLGPAAAGTWGYVFAIYSLGLLLSTLGTDQIVVVDLVAKREQRGTIMSTALGLRAIASAVVVATLLFASITIDTQSAEQNLLIRVVTLSVIAMSFDVIGNWFRSQLRFDRIAIPSIVSTAVGGAAKIFFVTREHSILPLGLLTVAQSLLMQAMIVFAAFRGGVGDIFRGFSFRYARELLRSSVPLMISGIAVFVYLRANVFFLNEIEGKADVGLYNAAAAISGISYFIPTVVVTALTPSLYRMHNEEQTKFERSFQYMTNMLVVCLSMIALAVMLFSHRIILALYGKAFLPAAAVLELHVWTVIPVALGLTSSVWLAAEKRTAVLMTRTVCGGVVNVALNLLLIPRLGIIGAAIATLVAMFTASMFMLPFLGKTARRVFVIQMRSLFLLNIVAMFLPLRRPPQLTNKRKGNP
jgi:O-antigen/teichoic acid export membrane protein